MPKSRRNHSRLINSPTSNRTTETFSEWCIIRQNSSRTEPPIPGSWMRQNSFMQMMWVSSRTISTSRLDQQGDNNCHHTPNNTTKPRTTCCCVCDRRSMSGCTMNNTVPVAIKEQHPAATAKPTAQSAPQLLNRSACHKLLDPHM